MAKILLVDDSESVLDCMATILKYNHHDVKAVKNKTDLMKTLYAFQPNIILLDVMLSGDDGRLICKQIKTTPPFNDVPVILFSASAAALKNYDRYKAVDAIEKPFSIDTLMYKINYHI